VTLHGPRAKIELFDQPPTGGPFVASVDRISHKPVTVSALVMSLAVTGLAVAQGRAKASGTPGPAAASVANGAAASDAEYRIGLDDVLDIAVWNNTVSGGRAARALR
jgi:hypothetical protein